MGIGADVRSTIKVKSFVVCNFNANDHKVLFEKEKKKREAVDA